MDVTQKFGALLKVDYPTEFIDGTIPVFKKRSKKEREQDKYDKEDFELAGRPRNKFVDKYTGLFAFGHILLGLGGIEGLYRTVEHALLSNLDRQTCNTVLDLGCGVGRLLYDCTELLPGTLLVGMDYAYSMCRRAHEILIDGKDILLDDSLSYTGFRVPRLKTKRAANVFIAQGDATELPFKDNMFDCVVNNYLVDRINQTDGPRLAIAEMVRVLRPGGLFVLSDPLNFEDDAPQKCIPDKETLAKLIEDAGVDITESFDGLVYREVKDARGNYNDFLSFVCVGRKQF